MMELHNNQRRCDGVLRRDMMRIGGLTALGLGVGDWFGMRRAWAEEARASAKSCIMIWLDGGPSHLETFDPKPDAPSEVRGPLASIATSLPGVRISECMPETAKMMDKVAIVRSMTSPLGEHNFGAHYLMTGYKPTPVLQYPTVGAVLAHVREAESRVLPPHIAVPTFRVGGGRMNGGGYLPASTRPFSVGGDPSKPDFKVQDLDFYKGLDLDRLDRRRQFVDALDTFDRDINATGGASDTDLERAYQLVSSSEAKQAFDLSDETQETRKRYGGKSIGQCCLLARRLVERGVPFVTVNNRGWDTHNNLYTRLKEGYTGARTPVGLVPSLDLAMTALIGDLEERGLLDETLIVVMGEFGRTPKLNTDAGRDHWPRAFSVALAGGGIRGGQIVGSSDSVGEGPKDRPVTPSDLAATIYTTLGVDPKRELRTADGRPVRVSPFEAEVIEELV